MEESQIFTVFLFSRLLINTITMIILVRFVYYNAYKKKDAFFTFFLLNLIVFLLAYILVTIGGLSSIGGAFGLLAAFSFLRFRNEAISMNDMTYLFVILAIGLINSILQASVFEVIALDALIVLAVFVVDGNLIIHTQKTKTIDYPSIKNIKPDRHEILISELVEHTGLEIKKVTIEHIDIRRDRALIKIYYRVK